MKHQLRQKFWTPWPPCGPMSNRDRWGWVSVWGLLLIGVGSLICLQQMAAREFGQVPRRVYSMAIKQSRPVPKGTQVQNSVPESPMIVPITVNGVSTTDQRYAAIIRRASQRYDIDPHIIKAIIMAESSFDPLAVSNKGAQGLMQLMPTTAKDLGVRNTFDPGQNIDAGVRFFKRLLTHHKGDLKLALAAYNAGAKNVRRYNGVPPFKATHAYIRKVLRYRRQFQDKA